MIDFSLDDEQDLLRRTARSFADGELRPGQRAREQARAVDARTIDAFRQAGFDELVDADPLSLVIVLEELARGDVGATFALVGPALAEAAARALGVDLRPAPSCVHVADAIESAPRWLPTGTTARVLTCTPDGRWRVNVVEGELVPSLGLLAAGGMDCARVETVAEGEATGESFRVAMRAMHLACGAMGIGLARASLEYACTYVQEREAFGRRLSQHQGLAFIVADMAMRTDAARLLLHAAAHDPTRDSAGALVVCSETAEWVTERGVQLLGGHGYMKAHPTEKWMRDARTLALLHGGRDLAVDLARERW